MRRGLSGGDDALRGLRAWECLGIAPDGSALVSDPLPAVVEADATGEIATLFKDIRDILGIGAVNLVWRHLATIPGALPWAWRAVRPRYADGSLAASAAAFDRGLALPTIPALPGTALSACGLGTADLAAIKGVLAAYARTNPQALLALSALRQETGREPTGRDRRFCRYRLPTAPPGIPGGALRRFCRNCRRRRRWARRRST